GHGRRDETGRLGRHRGHRLRRRDAARHTALRGACGTWDARRANGARVRGAVRRDRAEASLRPRLPGMLREVGLATWSRAAWSLRGGRRERDFGRLRVAHLRGHMIGAGLVTNEEVDRFLELTKKPEFGYLPLPMVTVWRRRPVEGCCPAHIPSAVR